jgi:hypothetical protein
MPIKRNASFRDSAQLGSDFLPIFPLGLPKRDPYYIPFVSHSNLAWSISSLFRERLGEIATRQLPGLNILASRRKFRNHGAEEAVPVYFGTSPAPAKKMSHACRYDLRANRCARDPWLWSMPGTYCRSDSSFRRSANLVVLGHDT